MPSRPGLFTAQTTPGVEVVPARLMETAQAISRCFLSASWKLAPSSAMRSHPCPRRAAQARVRDGAAGYTQHGYHLNSGDAASFLQSGMVVPALCSMVPQVKSLFSSLRFNFQVESHPGNLNVPTVFQKQMIRLWLVEGS